MSRNITEKKMKEITLREMVEIFGKDRLMNQINVQFDPILDAGAEHYAKYLLFQEQYKEPLRRAELPVHQEDDPNCFCYTCIDERYQESCREIKRIRQEHDERIKMIKEM